MQNYSLLRAVGKIRKPVLLKRGMAATITDLLMSAEYILAEGNDQVILCERGIRSFDTTTRNLFDLTAIPIVQRLSHLPMIADPSHGTGLRDKVIPMARAAVAAGADGIIVEVHPTPDRALSDGGQSLYPDQFARLVSELRAISTRHRPVRGDPCRNGRRRRRVANIMRQITTALLVACVAAPLGAQNVDATIDRAVAAWSKVKTVRGTFEQTVTNQITGSSATARGQYVQERPNRLSIRFSQPASDAIVADGKAVWIYLPSTSAGQVLKRPATDQAATPIDLTGQFLDSPRAKYDITAAGTKTVDGHSTRALKLSPKEGRERAVHSGNRVGGRRRRAHSRIRRDGTERRHSSRALDRDPNQSAPSTSPCSCSPFRPASRSSTRPKP